MIAAEWMSHPYHFEMYRVYYKILSIITHSFVIFAAHP